ncbi:hypothetical protein [Cetobacterium sp.]|uniref:hypothetical protein n=2 Tax=Cetobacterium sp. TaxID=2071632 RepID=UPI003EE67146
MIIINTTNINILKLLAQGQFSAEVLALYTNIEKESIKKNILQINEFLNDNNLNKIQKNNNKFSLKLTMDQWEYIFSRKDFITSEEISDYLFIKFIHNKFINLEVEKNILDLSRSSIVRYFQNIKKILDLNKTTYEYQNSKGIKLIYLSEECKNIFCKKIIRFFMSRDFKRNKDFFTSTVLSEYNFLDLLNNLHKILSSNKMSSTSFLMAFLCALNVICNISNGFDFKLKNINYDQHRDLEKQIFKVLTNTSFLYKQQVFHFIVNLKNSKFFFEEDIYTNGVQLLENIKIKFNLKELESNFRNILLKKICISLFKYNNNILKVKSISLEKIDNSFLYIIDNLLEECNLKLFFYDKISIINILKKFIVAHNKNTVKNVLLLFNEITILDDHHLINSLESRASHINFHIEPAFLYRLNAPLYNQKYNLVLSDESCIYQNIKLLSSYNYLNILNIINNHVLEQSLKNLKFN